MNGMPTNRFPHNSKALNSLWRQVSKFVNEQGRTVKTEAARDEGECLQPQYHPGWATNSLGIAWTSKEKVPAKAEANMSASR